MGSQGSTRQVAQSSLVSSESGFRQYPPETVRLIRFIKRAQDLGFTLKEIQELIDLRETRGRDRSHVRRLAAAKLADVDEKIGRLRAMTCESCDVQVLDMRCDKAVQARAKQYGLKRVPAIVVNGRLADCCWSA